MRGRATRAAGDQGHVASRFPQADQVIGRGGERERPIDEWDAAMPELAQTTDGLHPPKDLFHEFSFPLTHVITRMPGGPTINRTPADLLRHVGRDVPDADIGDEARHIVALVCSDRAARRRAGLQQQCRRLAFGGPRRRCCTNRHEPARCPPTGSSPADAIRHWSAEGGHPIKDLTAEDGLTPLPSWTPGAKTIADDGLVAEERILHQALTMVP